jgi:cytochrome c553
MKRIAAVLIRGILAIVTAGVMLTAQEVAQAPDWAYGYLKPVVPGEAVAPACPEGAKGFPDCAYPGAPVPENGIKLELPGAPTMYTRNEAYFDYGPADWYPGDHPAMPDIVAHGKQAEGSRACALCHYPNGQGKMENGGVAGLPAPYILAQLNAFKTGARRSSDPRKANTNEMARIAASLTDAEAKEAAAYFSSMNWRPWTRVVEADTAPAVRQTVNGLFMPIPNAAPIPLNGRIIEMPEKPERTDGMRDPHSGFVAYAPVGSIKRGQVLVTTGGNGKTIACANCHGADLRGLGPAPGIAGRSPSYLVRQMHDMQTGQRKGSWTELMKPVVEKLTAEDYVAIAAYVASRPQAAAPGTATAAR